MKKIMKGFTLVELIVVIAIVSALAALIIPNAVNNIREAQKAVDIENARMIAEAVELTLLTKADKTMGEKYTVAEAWTKHNTTVFTVTEGGESYKLVVVTKINGSKKTASGNNAACNTWGGCNNEAKAFQKALNESMGFPESSGKIHIKMKYYGPHDNGYVSDRYMVCYRANDPEKIEIWAGDSTKTWGSQPVARLYPEPGDEYRNVK